jgi:hypothetical protein
MSEEDLELLVTLDDPGEDDLGEDTFHNLQAGITAQPFLTEKQRDSKTIGIPEEEQ